MSEELEPVDQERIDRLIWKNVGLLPVSQVAKLAGIKPEEVLRRKSELLEEVDVLSVEQSRQKLMVDLQTIARKAQDDYDSSPWETKAGLLNTAISAMKQIFNEFNRSEKNNSAKIEALNNLRKREIVNLYVAVVNSGVGEISDKYGVPQEELFEVFNRYMREESQRLEV